MAVPVVVQSNTSQTSWPQSTRTLITTSRSVSWNSVTPQRYVIIIVSLYGLEMDKGETARFGYYVVVDGGTRWGTWVPGGS